MADATRKRIFGALLMGTAIVPLAVGGLVAPANAQQAAAKFRIERQPLAKALMALSREANVDIVAPASLTRNRTSGAVSAATVEAALAQMLQGSGLTFERSGNRYLVRSGNAARLASESLESAPAGQTKSGSQVVGGASGIVEGRVIDASSTANLKGALVKVLETGEEARTDSNGEFRLVRVPVSGATIQVSYLGYPPSTMSVAAVRGKVARADFSLDAGARSDIVVYASRSARAQAINQERTKENSATIISSDLLGEFGGQSISETLRRAPGVTFDRDRLTGDGTNISIRGLGPDLNAVKLNGIELPVGNGRDRSASLGNIQTESIERVTINKTLLPNMDTSGSGGLVEIETKSPLDRRRRFASASAEIGKRGKGFNDEFALSGTLSARFGSSENFGVSLSAQYQTRSIARITTNSSLKFGEYLPLQIDGTPIFGLDFIDPRLSFPFEEGASGVFLSQAQATSDQVDNENLTITASAAWDPTENTHLRIDYQTSRLTTKSLQRSAGFTAPSDYSLAPVGELGGEQRSALQWGGRLFTSGTYDYSPGDKARTDVVTLRGESTFGRLETKYSAGYTIGKTSSRHFVMGTSVPCCNSLVNPAFIDPSLVPTLDGRIMSLFATPQGSAPPVLGLTSAGREFYGNASSYNVNNLFETVNGGRNDRLAADFSAKYNFGPDWLRYVEVGVQYERSKFKSGQSAYVFYNTFNPASIDMYGLSLDDDLLRPIGRDSFFSVISPEAFRQFVNVTLPGITVIPDDPLTFDPSSLPRGQFYQSVTDFDALLGDVSTRETEIAGFAQGRIDIGKLEIIGGARFSQIRLHSRNFSQPYIYDENYEEDVAFRTANTRLVAGKATQFTILPRVLMNFRPSENLVFRGGYFLSVSRPQISLLSSEVQTTLILAPFSGPLGNQPELDLASGNPDLKPAYTHSFDIGGEYYFKDVGVAKINFFYKKIKNLFELNNAAVLDSLSGIELPDDPRFEDVRQNPGNYYIRYIVPENNPNPATVWGFEASLERQLKFLPGALGGLGIFANYTYSRSSKTQPYTWSYAPVTDSDGNVVNYKSVDIDFENVRLDNQSRHSGTVGLTYSKYNIDARLNYTMQSRRGVAFSPYNLGSTDSAYRTLDGRIEYRVPRGLLADLRLYLEGYDLLHGPSDPSRTATYAGVVTGADYFGGRQIRLGISKTF